MRATITAEVCFATSRDQSTAPFRLVQRIILFPRRAYNRAHTPPFPPPTAKRHQKLGPSAFEWTHSPHRLSMTSRPSYASTLPFLQAVPDVRLLLENTSSCGFPRSFRFRVARAGIQGTSRYERPNKSKRDDCQQQRQPTNDRWMEPRPRGRRPRAHGSLPVTPAPPGSMIPNPIGKPLKD